jgi:hypothetical protein
MPVAVAASDTIEGRLQDRARLREIGTVDVSAHRDAPRLDLV